MEDSLLHRVHGDAPLAYYDGHTDACTGFLKNLRGCHRVIHTDVSV